MTEPVAGTAAGSAPIDVGSGPTVLLVHGQPGAGADWQALAGVLAADHRVLAPDRPGWGGDQKTATGLAANADELAALLDRALVSDPVIVVGHSLGGAIALELALRHPGRVCALVLIGSVGVSGALSGVDRLLAVPVLGDSLVRAGLAGVRRAFATASRLSGDHPAARVARRVENLPTVRVVVGEATRPTAGRARRSFVIEQRALLAETPSIERRLGRVRAPTVVVNGAADRFVTPAVARQLAGHIPGAELVIVPGGHLLPFDEPELVGAVVRRYAALAATRGPH